PPPKRIAHLDNYTEKPPTRAGPARSSTPPDPPRRTNPGQRPTHAARSTKWRTRIETNHKRGLAAIARPELNADPRSRRPRRFRHRMLPGALTGATHYQQVAVALRQAQAPAAVAWSHRENPSRTEADDGHHGVLGAAAADRVAV